MTLDQSHVYVVGEEEEPDGPVKIGMTTVGLSGSGRANLRGGNWRHLYVEHRWMLPFETVRWTEWCIHTHLVPWHVRGEWFDVRSVAGPYGWDAFLRQAAAGDIPRCASWRLRNGSHELVRMRRLTRGEPRQFDAECSCGAVVVGALGRTLPSVLVAFATDHLGLAPDDRGVVALRGRL